MNKKISLGLTVALILLSITATFALTMTVSQNIYNGLISKLSNRFELYDGISAIDNYVRTNYYGEFDDDSLFAQSASGYMKGLSDSGSFYMTAQEYIEYTRKLKGEGGIGVEAEYSTDKGKVVITEVYAGSSAENAELKKGDAIIKVDDVDVTIHNAANVIDSLRIGRRFDSVTLTYERDGAQKTVTVMRGYTKTVTASFVGNVGYVRINGFFANTAEQFSAEIDSLNAQGVTALIIDLRGCKDGTIEYAAAVADLILPSGAESAGAIASAVKRDGSVYKNFTSDASAITFPKGMAVLVDNTTSGGAELLAAQLKDFSKASLIGTKTSGQMTMQEIYTLEDGSAISLTVAKVISYSGAQYCNGNGIEPTYTVELGLDGTLAKSLEGIEKDPQLQSAYATLMQ
ncbi:MAG: PDZ domain-containing protein [Clostridia bacterium]|nr:PDZ domain-containing protein [Clostridia bacterium]